jgi:hypothetical protein
LPGEARNQVPVLRTTRRLRGLRLYFGGAEGAAVRGERDRAEAFGALACRLYHRRPGASHECADGLHDEVEDDGRDDDERDECVDERAVEEVAVVNREADVGEVVVAGDGGDQRRDQVSDERGDDRRERDAEDDADCGIDQAAAEQKLFKVAHARGFDASR